MATMQKFSCAINEEGPSRVKRAKVPSGLINLLGGEKGDQLEFEVTGKMITGGRILRGRAAEAARNVVHSQSRPVTSKAPAVKSKAPAVKSKVPAPKGKIPTPKGKIPAPAQPTGRKTAVKYETPKIPAKAGSPKPKRRK